MHYKVIQLALLIIIPTSLSAQKYKLSFEQKANYSIYNFSTSLPYSIPGRDLKPRVGFESGIRFFYTPKEKVTYYIGIGFNKYNYTSGKFEVRTSDQILPRPGFLEPKREPGTAPSEIKLNYSYNYLSIPLGVQYKIKKRLIVGAGFKVLRKLSVYGYSKYYYTDSWKAKSNYDKKTFDNEGYSPWAINLDTEVGYILPVLKYNITWKAAFEYALSDYIGNEYRHLNLFPYTFSMGASFPLYSSKN